jgi:hypothetical protein
VEGDPVVVIEDWRKVSAVSDAAVLIVAPVVGTVIGVLFRRQSI